MDPIMEQLMLTGYPSKEYLDYERTQEDELEHGPFDDFRDFLNFEEGSHAS